MWRGTHGDNEKGENYDKFHVFDLFFAKQKVVSDLVTLRGSVFIPGCILFVVFTKEKYSVTFCTWVNNMVTHSRLNSCFEISSFFTQLANDTIKCTEIKLICVILRTDFLFVKICKSCGW